jgi:UDP-N-acetylmuramate--alanine ligase
LAAIEDAFDRFLAGATRLRVVCADDPLAASIGARHDAVSYGTSEGATYRIADLVVRRARTEFAVVRAGERLAEVVLPVPGAHNARNATAALATAVELGLPVDAAVRSLARFAGVARRFQFRGEAAGVTVVDDYAHNPGKLHAVIDAARHGGWGRVVCVFQPHRYSRTAALGAELGAALAPADVVVVTDVYGAGEAAIPGVTGLLVARAAIDARPWGQVAYLPRRADVVPYLGSRLRAGDLCLTLGAGDVTAMADDILAAVGRREVR